MKKRTSYSKKINLPPGSLVYTGNKIIQEPEISSITYSNSQFEKKDYEKGRSINFPKNLNEDSIFWLNIKGVSSASAIEKIGNSFQLHPLLLEDILNTNQRPKFEEYDDYIFLVLRRIDWKESDLEINSEQIAFVLSGFKLLSFQEQKDDFFAPIEQRIEKSKGRIRGSDVSYLLYSIMDSIVDKYFFSLEQIGEKIDELEQRVSEKIDPEVVKQIHSLKHTMTIFKKSVWPLREVINYLIRTENDLISPSNVLYYRDLSDHIYQVLDTVENYRELLSSLLDLYLTMIGNKTNDIMKVLTIIATIFIPLTFIAGVYGMNFKFMPELSSPWGYPIIWFLMIVISGVLLYYFRKKKWI